MGLLDVLGAGPKPRCKEYTVEVKVGDWVKWSSSRKALGRVVQIFNYRTSQGKEGSWAVLDTHDPYKGMIVVRVYEALIVCPRPKIG